MAPQTTPMIVRPGLLAALMFWSLAASPLACFEPKSVVCPRSGQICAKQCAADGVHCVEDSCGNMVIDPGEQCDDGNQSESDDCLNNCKMARCGDGVLDKEGAQKEECDYTSDPACNLDCTRAACGDSKVSARTAEECDNGADNTASCNGNLNGTHSCKVARCGDGITNTAAGELCDDGNKDNTDACLTNCQEARCGDGYVNHPPGHDEEACDDGNQDTEEKCPYGVQSCVQCNADCSSLLKLTGSYCGDGVLDPGEVCDDGNGMTEQSCPLGQPTCSACNADCSKVLDLQAPVCGNGAIEWGENCDDGNTESCGTCDSTCTHWNNVAKATGSIEITHFNDISQSQYFSINDGVHERLFFEFDTDGEVREDAIPVNLNHAHDGASLATEIATTINGLANESFLISAVSSGNRVLLTQRLPGYFGDKAIRKPSGLEGFSVSGMAGGELYRCREYIGCASDLDCAVTLHCDEQSHRCSQP